MEEKEKEEEKRPKEEEEVDEAKKDDDWWGWGASTVTSLTEKATRATNTAVQAAKVKVRSGREDGKKKRERNYLEKPLQPFKILDHHQRRRKAGNRQTKKIFWMFFFWELTCLPGGIFWGVDY